MIVTFLGTGASHGVPVVGCDCDICRSTNPKNNRTRSAVYVETRGVRILIDTPPELRIQLLRERITGADALCYTHAHADHLFGLDDIRRFSEKSKHDLDVYAKADVVMNIRTAYEYAFRPAPAQCTKPGLSLHEIRGPFDVKGVKVIPVPVMHGKLPILGYRIGNFAYVTDCSYAPPESIELIRGVDTLVFGTIRYDEHPTHMNVDQACEFVKEIGAGRAYFTHMSHKLDYDVLTATLPENIRPAYDGLKIEIDEASD
ncbi:MAG: MBL fold metallo-hydrolase [Abditibacteriota bacterium]|nr:MBL fold metallo-hydrolase [Abditibacteriota bacterium]